MFFTILLDSLGFGILIPIIPQLLANPESSFFLLSSRYTLEQGYMFLGVIIAVYPLGIFFAAPLLGQLSDWYGRKRLWAFSLAGTFISYLLFSLAISVKNIPLLIVARALHGFTGGNIAIAQAAIADVTRPEDRSKNFGLIGAAFGLGFIIGPFLGGTLSDPSVVSWFNAATPFWLVAVLSLINLAVLWIVVPETNTTRSFKPLIWNQAWRNIVRAAKNERLRPLFTTGFLFHLGFSFFVTFFGVFLVKRFSFLQGDIGNYFAYIGLWVVFTQAVITRFVARWFREAFVLRYSLIATGFGILLLLFAGRPETLYFFSPLFAVANGLSIANLAGMVSRSTTPREQGETLGMNASVQALAQFIAPVLSGILAVYLNSETPMIVAAASAILAGLYFHWRFRFKL